MRRRIVWLICLVAVLFLLSMAGSLFWIDRARSPGKLWLSSNKIGVVQIRGLIIDSKDTLEKIKTFREDPDIKAILVRIESPGGGVGPSQEIYGELLRTVKEKPVVASMGSIAASGGYYIAAATNRIVANPGTLTGSIGVIVNFSNLQGLFEKIGYDMVTIKSGRFKDLGNPNREMTPEEKMLVQQMIDVVHHQFIRDVARGRNLPEKDVEEIADGRVLTGETAQQLKLVDELGNFNDAVNAAAVLANISGEPEIVYAEKKKFSVVDFLLGEEATAMIHNFLNGASQPVRYQAPFPFSP